MASLRIDTATGAPNTVLEIEVVFPPLPQCGECLLYVKTDCAAEPPPSSSVTNWQVDRLSYSMTPTTCDFCKKVGSLVIERNPATNRVLVGCLHCGYWWSAAAPQQVQTRTTAERGKTIRTNRRDRT